MVVLRKCPMLRFVGREPFTHLAAPLAGARMALRPIIVRPLRLPAELFKEEFHEALIAQTQQTHWQSDVAV